MENTKSKMHFTVAMVRRLTVIVSPVLAKMLILHGTLPSYLITLTCISGSFSAKAIIDLVFSMFGLICSYNEHGFEQPLSLSIKIYNKYLLRHLEITDRSERTDVDVC